MRLRVVTLGAAIGLIASLPGFSMPLPAAAAGPCVTQTLAIPATATTPNLSAPSGIAIDAAGKIYVADPTTKTLFRFTSGTQDLAITVPGTTGATGKAALPLAIAVDAAGNNIYTLDRANNLLDRFTKSLTLPETWTQTLSVTDRSQQGYGIAVDAAGNIYAADATGKTLRRFNSAGTQTMTIPSTAATPSLLLPEGIAVDATGNNIYAADAMGKTLYRFTKTTTTPETWTQTLAIPSMAATPNLGTPQMIAVDAAGSIYTADANIFPPAGKTLYQFDSTGTQTLAIPPTAAAPNLVTPFGIAVDPTGNLYTTDNGTKTPATPNIKIYGFSPTGSPCLPQTIAFTSHAPGNAVVRGALYTVTGTATSGVPVSFSIDASATAVCSVAGARVSFTGVGTCVIDANQAGDGQYLAAPQVQQSFTVGKGSQGIFFVGPGVGSVGGSDTLSATATSGLPVVFSVDASSDPGVCAVSGLNGSTVNYTGLGNCLIDANQPGDANNLPAVQVQWGFAVVQGVQTITFVAPITGNVGGSTTLSATGGGSPNPVVFSVDATSGVGVCNVSGLNGSTLNYTAVGFCVIDANQAGDANYTAAAQVQQIITVAEPSSTATTVVDDLTGSPWTNTEQVGASAHDTATVTGVAGIIPTGSVTYNLFSGDCISGFFISGETVPMNADGSVPNSSSTLALTAGNYAFQAVYSGDLNYFFSTSACEPFSVGATSVSTVVFDASTNLGWSQTEGTGASAYDTAMVSTSASVTATGTVTYTFFSGDCINGTVTSIDPVTINIDGSVPNSTSTAALGAGTYSFQASYGGDSNYASSTSPCESFTVAKGPQTITFTSTAPVGAVVGGLTYTVSATGGASGNPVVFTIDSAAAAVCSISSAVVSFIGAGSCVIDANQAGDANYLAAPQAQQSFTVGQGSQTISFTSNAPVGAVVGGPTYTVTATATSGLAVSFAIDPSATSVCSIAGAVVSFIGAGSCVIDANQAGDANYLPAPQVQQSFSAGKGSQTISFTSIAPAGALVGGPTYTVAATATSGLPVSFAIDASATSVCSIAGAVVSLTGTGTCVIDANQAGDANYTPAPQVQQTFKVTPAGLTITASSDSMVYGGPVPTITPSYAGFVNGDTAASLTTQPTCATTATSASPVGSYVSSCSGAVDPNYTITYVVGTTSVTPAALTITASSDSMVYGGPVPTVTPSYGGFVNGDTAASLTTKPTCSTAATSSSQVGSYPSSCSGAVDPNYTIAYVAGTTSVTPAALTITASSASMVYGGPVPVITAGYAGFVNSDSAASLTTAPTCSTTATSASPVGSYPSSCTGASDPNYTVTYVPGTISVTTDVLTITASSASMVYGGPVPTITPGYSGFVNGDTPASLTTAPTCSTTATNSSPVGSYPSTCSGAVDANYTISYVAGSVTVTPAALTITASSDSMVYGGPVPIITAGYAGFVNGDTAASLATAPTCSTLATSLSPVGLYASSCSGAVDANYTIAYVAGTTTVTPAGLTITASSASVVYGGPVPAVTPAYAGFVNGDTAASLTSQPTCATAASSSSPVGAYPSSCSGAVDANYAITYVTGTISVTPAALTITASSGSTVYGGSVPAITAGYTGFVNGDTPNSLTTAPTCSTTATSASPVGSYPSSCSGATDPNYTISYVPGTVVVTPAPLTITASSDSTVYGGPVPTITPGYTGFVNGDTAASLTTQPICTTTATSASPVGSYVSSCPGAVDPNYAITYVPGITSITPAALTITATSDSMVYGGPVPTITALYAGFVNGDAAASLTPQPTCSTAATTSSPVGPYPSSCSGAVDANYAITYVTGTISVTPAALTITASSGSMVYGGSVPAIAAGYTGFVNSDTASSLTTPPTCTTAASSASPVGSYLSSCAGAVDANYTISYVAGTVAVMPAALTITASSDSMAYGGPVPVITAGYAGFVNGDTAASLTGAPTCTTAATSTSPVGSYPSSCSGAVDANYTISYVSGVVAVAPAVLTVTANDKTKTVGSPNPAFDATITGFVNGDTLAVVSGSPSCTSTAVTGSPVGLYPITCAIGTLTASNYSFTFVAGTLYVKADQTIHFGRLPNRTLAQSPVIVHATASSGLTVTFSTTTPTVCTSGGPNGATITLVATGTCTVHADQPGNATYNAAPTVSRSFTVTKAHQTINFGALSNKTLAQSPVTAHATASSGLAVTFSTTTPAVCTSGGINGATITLIATGTCTVNANQSGNLTYNPAPTVSRSFLVSKAHQTIRFRALANRTLQQSPFTVSATASSGLPVTFTTSTPSVCTSSGATGTTISLIDTGLCIIEADQAGDATYDSAPGVSRSFTVS